MVAKLGCTGPCSDVVEFGCGYGTFTVAAARATRGQVFALDIDAEMVSATTRKVEEAGLANVIVVQRDFVSNGTGRPDGQAGYAMLFNILHVEDPVGLLREAARILAPGGLVGAIHWRTDLPTPRGPSLKIRPTPQQCQEWGEIAGLDFVRCENLCCCSWHWGMVLRKPIAD